MSPQPQIRLVSHLIKRVFRLRKGRGSVKNRSKRKAPGLFRGLCKPNQVIIRNAWQKPFKNNSHL
jgi:hypothetical protein